MQADLKFTEFEEFIQSEVEKARGEQKFSSSESIVAAMIHKFGVGNTPTTRWVRDRKKLMGFLVFDIKDKPRLNEMLLAARRAFRKKEQKLFSGPQSRRWVFYFDHKWFGEVDSTPRYEARAGDLVPMEIKFRGQAAETKTHEGRDPRSRKEFMEHNYRGDCPGDGRAPPPR